MRLRRVSQRELRRDRHLKPRRFDRTPKMLELPAAWHAVVRFRLDPGPMLWLGLDSVRIREAPTFPEHVDAALERLATRERQDRVDTVGRALMRSGNDVTVPA